MPRRRVTAKTESISAPINGWNARDSISAMNETDAVSLINLWPTPTDVRLRLGYSRATTGGFATNNNVNTLMPFNGNVQRLFAGQGNQVWDVTGTTAVSQNLALTNDRFQYVQTSTVGGVFLIAVNGADDAIIYNGTNWIRSAKSTTGRTITSISVAGTTATLTTSTAHGLFTNNQIVITGAIPTALNGAWIITGVPSATTATFTVPAGVGNATTVGSYSVTAFTNVDSATLLNINLFKNRIWFTPRSGSTVYYSDVNAISGDLSPFPLGGVMRRGGNIVACGTWTIDAGGGVDDLLVFASDQGEIIVYMGTDPSNATMFALKGVWQLGSAFTPRCFHKFAGDLLLLLRDGLVPLASALQSSRLDPRVNLTDKIFSAITGAVADFSQVFGWQVIYYPQANMLIINVPQTSGSVQYVMNTISKAWAQFTGIDAYTFALFQDRMYFGGAGFVGQYWSQPSDAGSNIVGTVQQAYSYFGARSQTKRFTLARPTFLIDAGINPSQAGSRPGVVVGLNYDFALQNNLAPATFSPGLSAIGLWNQAQWDSSAVWGTGGLEVNAEWETVDGLGFSAGLAMNLASQGFEFRWVSTDYVYELGAIL